MFPIVWLQLTDEDRVVPHSGSLALPPPHLKCSWIFDESHSSQGQCSADARLMDVLTTSTRGPVLFTTRRLLFPFSSNEPRFSLTWKETEMCRLRSGCCRRWSWWHGWKLQDSEHGDTWPASLYTVRQVIGRGRWTWATSSFRQTAALWRGRRNAGRRVLWRASEWPSRRNPRSGGELVTETRCENRTWNARPKHCPYMRNEIFHRRRESASCSKIIRRGKISWNEKIIASTVFHQILCLLSFSLWKDFKRFFSRWLYLIQEMS